MGQTENSRDGTNADGSRSPSDEGKLELDSVYVPSPNDYQMTPVMHDVYQFGQKAARVAIREVGLQDGMTALLSGITRELRRHVTADAAKGILQGLADTITEAAKYDVPDKK